MGEDPRYRLDKRRVRAAFDRAAESYDKAAPLQREVCERLLERLDLVRLVPRRVLDAGAGTGQGVRGLRRRYPKSLVVGLDISSSMLLRARRGSGWWNRPAWLCGDLESLPLADACMDLVFSNLALQWCDLELTLAGLRRVMVSDGLLTFTTFGPDTLKELREAWHSVDDQNVHVNAFMDMHDVGDALLRAGFRDPVMDMEMMTVTYPALEDLLADLRAIGATNANRGRGRGLYTRGSAQRLRAAYEAFRLPDGRLPASYEVIYGHAWAPGCTGPGPSETPVRAIPIRSVP